MTADRLKHLEFLQSTISRMAGNSFLLKGWTVTLVAALFALAAKESDKRLIVLALFPSVAFWGLDAYYLCQERLFRMLYDDLRKLPQAEYEKSEPFSMSTKKYSHGRLSWFRTLWTPTLVGLHGVIFFTIIVFVLVVKRR
ncbi:MAG TPA: hypothetical protein VEH50_08070 [Methylomirabilota bacterium]|nr:hypothetical protein [Methylomirabilota bacterium]